MPPRHYGRHNRDWNATCLQFGKLCLGELVGSVNTAKPCIFRGTSECFACRTVPIRCIILHLICMPDDMDNILLLCKVTSDFEMLLNFYAYGMKNGQRCVALLRIHHHWFAIKISHYFHGFSKFPPSPKPSLWSHWTKIVNDLTVTYLQCYHSKTIYSRSLQLKKIVIARYT